MIEVIEDITIYDNPRPQVHSRHGIFPDLLELPGGELLALFVLGEAFESPNSTTVVSRSQDGGRSWTLQGPLYDKSVDPVVSSDGMKATRLRDGRLIAVGYRFYRHDLEQGISLEETGGILPGDDVVSFSEDEGRTWTVPRVIPRSHPELLEISGPCIQTADGDLLAVAGIFKMPDGSNPSGQYGVLFRSRDNRGNLGRQRPLLRTPRQGGDGLGVPDLRNAARTGGGHYLGLRLSGRQTPAQLRGHFPGQRPHLVGPDQHRS